MYILILLGLLACSGWVVFRGITRRSSVSVISGVCLGLAVIFFFSMLSFWGEMLWFDNLGYEHRFWTVIVWQVSLFGAGALLAMTGVWLLTLGLSRKDSVIRRGAGIAALVLGGIWLSPQWETVLKFIHRVSTDLNDPILNKDTGFYLFTLPFLDTLYGFLFMVAVVGGAAVLGSLVVRIEGGQVEIEGFSNEQAGSKRYRPLYRWAGVFLLVLAYGKYLDRYHLMYSTLGAVTGPGWTDVLIRLPGYIIVAGAMVLGALILFFPGLPDKIARSRLLRRLPMKSHQAAVVGVVGIAIGLVWFMSLTILPRAFQWLRVEPNEITLEKPYIANNIEFTRHGFNIHTVEEQEFPVTEEFSRSMVEENSSIFANVRLWDWRALDAVYKQFQEIRLYYEFVDVDVDRYHFGNNYRQVMVSAREMEQDNLPDQSRTFVNTRYKYTHGYGITLTNVSEFTPQGLPNLLIRDIPPKSAFPRLEVSRPEIYYGELTDSYVVTNSQEPEFDFPRGDENEYVRYAGNGGVQLSNFWRKFLFGWKFDGTKFLFSGYPTAESRIMFHRQIRERVATIAPFLELDQDPYVVLSEGKLYWILDAYSVSSDYPYSEPFTAGEVAKVQARSGQGGFPVQSSIHGMNYIRNSVKVVVDAYEGSVEFFVFDPGDPLIQVWSAIFPGLFKNKDELRPELRKHVRYPADMLLIQGLVYAKYHMTDPTVFYNQEDLWIRATETYYGRVQPVDPYYIMWEPPGKNNLEFILMMPFTPKNRQVLIGWIAGMCDGDNYGRFLSYNFPKEKRVLGTQQVETKIDQDSYLSGQLSLWDQRGSRVVRGNVLVMPIDETLIYVEPIYLQAETAAYPELRLVVVMHNDNLSYAETFDQALEGLFGEGKPEIRPGPIVEAQNIDELISRAQEAFESYLDALGQKNFQAASDALSRLQSALMQLSEDDQEGVGAVQTEDQN